MLIITIILKKKSKIRKKNLIDKNKKKLNKMNYLIYF